MGCRGFGIQGFALWSGVKIPVGIGLGLDCCSG
jgi:hypothetical protein